MTAPTLQEIVQDLRTLVQESQSDMVLHYQDEPDPLTLDFIFTPSLQEEPEAADPVAESPPAFDPPGRNFTCSRCPERLYPVKHFLKTGSLPILILNYNGAVGEAQTRLDRSGQYLFNSSREDNLFQRLAASVDMQVSDFNVQEFLACHFNSERSTPGDWNQRTENCLEHVQQTIRDHGIQVVLLMGYAAVFLCGEEEARKLAASGKPIQLPLEGATIPAFVTRSPAAVLAIEDRRRQARESGKPEHADLLQRERQIKDSMIQCMHRVKNILDPEV